MALQPTVMTPRLRDQPIIVANVLTVNRITQKFALHWTLQVSAGILMIQLNAESHGFDVAELIFGSRPFRPFASCGRRGVATPVRAGRGLGRAGG
jgi:hypothetical protein